MPRYPLIAVLLLASPTAFAAIPGFSATCPGDLSVHADAGGPVFVNGREAKLKTFNENYYEARDEQTGTIISINRNPDGSTAVSYTGKGRANGTCTLEAAK